MPDSFDHRRPGGFGLDQASLFGDAEGLGYGPGKKGVTVYDEIATGAGRLRTHWQPLLARLSPLDSREMAERVEESNRLLRQNDVTYTIYNDPQSTERLWPLDVIPLLITADEWRDIEAGVIQRARLIEALIADIYGAQQMIGEGILPPALIEANPAFLRACHGTEPAGGAWLHLSAVDLARAPDGRWWVLSDRTEAPSGAGYALENRSVIGRVLADCIDDRHVKPLAPFFAALRDGLAMLTPEKRDHDGRPPRIVLLTPGPYNETYFEHLYLAGHLGITLVEGADLTVRDRRVYIKTVSALEPVDIILRRVDDSFCDPLELNPDSALGVAGLIEAVRARTVTVANALGSGVLQAAAFKPFLPALARRLIGEELTLPDVASWWCGGADALAHVLGNLDKLVVKNAFPAFGAQPVFGAELSAKDRAALAARIEASPIDFVAQERVPLSNVPVWTNGRIEPRPLSLRVYVAHGPDGFVVMPGGLTRIARAGGSSIVSMQSGGGSKDTWILDSSETAASPAYKPARDQDNVIALPEPLPRLLGGSPNELPSRAADGLFWTGRYAERADGMLRLLRTIVTGLTDPARGWGPLDAEPLLNLAAWLNLIPWTMPGGNPTPGLIAEVQSAIVDTGHPAGVRALLGRLAGTAGAVRDRLPADCWRAVTALSRPPRLSGFRATPVQIILRLDELVMLSTSLTGSIDESMPRNDGWRFLEIGKRLERAMHLVTVLRGMSGVAATKDDKARRVSERRHLNAIVALVGTRLSPDGQPVNGLDRKSALEAVLTNGNDPRSLAYQLSALAQHLAALPQPAGGTAGDLVARTREQVDMASALVKEAIAAATQGALRHKDIDAPDGADSIRAAFAPLDAALPEISNLLSQAYFTHAFARRA
ncbi:MAG TPA: circularly permuted type 2 ATP-grasp protein [Parvibaculum sp.]